MDIQKAKEKIRKLLSLATSSNSHEASLAMEKARELLLQFSLTEDEISPSKKQMFTEAVDILVKGHRTWIDILVSAVELLFPCCLIYRKGSSSVFLVFGNHELATQVTADCLRFSFSSALKNVKSYLSTVTTGSRIASVGLKFAYLEGFATGVLKQVQYLRTLHSEDTKALLVLKDSVLEKQIASSFSVTETPEVSTKVFSRDRDSFGDYKNADAVRVGFEDGRQHPIQSRLEDSNDRTGDS